MGNSSALRRATRVLEVSYSEFRRLPAYFLRVLCRFSIHPTLNTSSRRKSFQKRNGSSASPFNHREDEDEFFSVFLVLWMRLLILPWRQNVSRSYEPRALKELPKFPFSFSFSLGYQICNEKIFGVESHPRENHICRHIKVGLKAKLNNFQWYFKENENHTQNSSAERVLVF